MINTSPSVSGSPTLLRASEVRASFIGWGLYMAALVVYCMTYEVIVSSVPLDIRASVLWAVREWGIWLLITPVAFGVLRHYRTKHQKFPVYLGLAVGVLTVSLSFRIALDLFTAERDAVASFVIFFPRHLAALAVVVLAWHVFLRNSPPDSAGAGETDPQATLEPQKDDTAESGGDGEYPKVLFVSKGQDECLIWIDRIQCISAAGNYVEICADNEHYLMRATMKQVEQLLPPTVFVRTHRSHIVNIREIDRIKTHASGSASVHLKCGKTLSVSKKYRPQLNKYRLQPA